ncbi:LysR substrate-binding domain-containing protein [Halomonas sp. M1]|uniref:LysR substrate-binding domain-containing protein n=1 Tax=unclassified Halomonas TaxID=2609666 RepID=UPI00023A5E8C|nr:MULTISPECIES: LysR substrate-binding domain-containing protein [unclassified Halomonas]AVI64089.1 LysR family transcriptional regulator [Halomonas sp. GFAJ-1]EHK60217.1 LysR family transcriptional regulator [Halomonas sp. GFAJ-1]WFE71266.1 LysR substrate-binding domain-containing protein [Halomonas sp. M1]
MIRELKTLVAVAQHGTFAAAGQQVGLTQAAVSAQMKRLEEALGLTLFERSGRAAVLTQRGQETLLQAQALLGMYATLGDSPSHQGLDTRLTIGAIASIQRTLLPAVLARFHRRYPECHTRLVPGLSMDLMNQVDAGELDMAVIIRPPFSLHSDLRWTPLAHEPFRLLVPRQLPGEEWRELLTHHPFVRYDRTSFGGRQVDRFLRDNHCQVRDICEVDELDAIVQLVADGVGVALVPQPKALKRWPKGVRAIDLGERTIHRDIGLIHRTNGHLSQPARALSQLIGTIAS